ncbi:unnamed protein product (macronuclear) [Paramecium tetraurelia]|uniref:IQ calmodulin-binding motif protein n=1 Tax=Paramecium tetraurelia TaxID=5888 RepID=A0BMZ5_PARTE|nr:uncharacterized protein GSPATT00030549001 [Paramecium tetraurelia]CAK59912.1 unnamed protein product [Paramecium tetraurelia]|eukprot:XP_001427310.1 hypothetical protein (macronuclear) [Paramecium tetraurelia strain d4-2]
MNRNIPIGNKICATKEIFQNQNILNTHLSTMRPQINTSAPKQYEFLKNKKIKEAIKSQKQQEIDRENYNLISKLNNIMQQQSNNSISNFAIKKSTTVSLGPKKSLNKDHRKKELIKIVMENQLLLKRIQDQKSQYNVKDWNQERRWVEKQISNICEYPYKDFKPTKTLVQYWTNSRISESSLQKRDNFNNKKLDPLEIKNQQTKSRTRQDNDTETRQILTNQEYPQRSLFDSDFQPYEPYQDKISKIVQEIIEKPQQQEQVQKQEDIEDADDEGEKEQLNIQGDQDKVGSNDNQMKEQEGNKNNVREEQLQQQNEVDNLIDNSQVNKEQLEEGSNQSPQSPQNIQTIDFEQQNQVTKKITYDTD